MWGIFPLKDEISWEAHLFGAISGLLVAFNYRKEGPQRKVYDWENEEDDDDESSNQEPEGDIQNIQGQDIIINYHFIPTPLDPPQEKREDEEKTKE